MNFDAVKGFRVLMIGDGIRDVYRFQKPLGKSMKESTLSTLFVEEKAWPGGIWAAAEHVRKHCAHVDVMHGPRVMINRRLVEGTRKLHSEHEESFEPASPDFDIPSYDVVIVADFGHGTMTPRLIERVSREARFLAVNAQTNSSNFGFNLITKYPRADYVVIDKIEAQLAARDNVSAIEDVILALGYRKMVVTLGSDGAIGFDGEFYRQPAGADRVVDTIGAGDAFLAVSAPFAAARASIRELVEIGNRAGAQKVGIMGHERAVSLQGAA